MKGRSFFKNPMHREQLNRVRRRPWTPPSGRGQLTLMEFSDGVAVARPYRHGGLRRLIAPRWFIKTDRPQREFAIHDQLFQAGFPTPQPLGWWESPTWIPWVCRYVYLSRWIAHAETLPKWFTAGNLCPQHEAQIADALVALFKHGVQHGDLNLNNWILADGRVYLLDFDKAKRNSDMTPEQFLAAAFRRMGRSGRKLGLDDRRGKTTFARLMVRTAHRLQLDPKPLMRRVTAELDRSQVLHRWTWFLSGGHRHP